MFQETFFQLIFCLFKNILQSLYSKFLIWTLLVTVNTINNILNPASSFSWDLVYGDALTTAKLPKMSNSSFLRKIKHNVKFAEQKHTKMIFKDTFKI